MWGVKSNLFVIIPLCCLHVCKLPFEGPPLLPCANQMELMTVGALKKSGTPKVQINTIGESIYKIFLQTDLGSSLHKSISTSQQNRKTRRI